MVSTLTVHLIYLLGFSVVFKTDGSAPSQIRGVSIVFSLEVTHVILLCSQG